MYSESNKSHAKFEGMN